MSYQTVYVHCPQVSQQRKFSTDVLICPTKALLLLKKPCAFSFSCFYELKSNLRHTVFPFHSVIRFDTSYLKYNGIHTTSKPAQQESSSMRSTCLCFKPVFMPCGVPWDLYENMTMIWCILPESLEHKCDWIENVAHTVKTTLQKNPGWLIHERLNIKGFGAGVSDVKITYSVRV